MQWIVNNNYPCSPRLRHLNEHYRNHVDVSDILKIDANLSALTTTHVRIIEITATEIL